MVKEFTFLHQMNLTHTQMINMELEFKRSALKQLKYYKKKNPIAYKLIREKLEEILNNPEDSDYKKVKKYPKYKRARKGNYRICFRVDNNCIYIARIEDYSKAYQQFFKQTNSK